jgi:hypothetical protein
MPLSTKQIDRVHTPELFFQPRMTPHPAWVIDTEYVFRNYVMFNGREYVCVEGHTSATTPEENNEPNDRDKWLFIGMPPYAYEDLPDNPGVFIDVPVYDLPHVEKIYGNGKGLKRRAKPKAGAPDTPVDQTANCYLEKITGKFHLFVKINYDGDEVCTYEIRPEYWDGNSWEFQAFEGDIEIDNELGVMSSTGVQGGFSWDFQMHFSADDWKWSWDLTAPGFTGRLAVEIAFTTLGQQMVSDGDFQVDFSDYGGNVSDDEGIVTRLIYVEEAGIDLTSGWLVDPYLSVSIESTYIDVFCDGYYVRTYYLTANAEDRLVSIGDVNYGDFRTELVEEGGTLFGFHFDDDRVLTVVEDTPTRVILKKSGQFEDASNNALSNSGAVDITYTFYSDRVIHHLNWVTTDPIDLDNSAAQKIFGFFDASVPGALNIAEISDVEKYHDEDGPGDPDLTHTYRTTSDYMGFKSDKVNMTLVEVEHTDNDDFVQHTGGHGEPSIAWNDSDAFPAGTHTMTAMFIIDSADRENEIVPGTWNTWDLIDDDANVPVGFIANHMSGVTGGDLVGHWKMNDNAASTVIVDATGNNNGILDGGDNTEDKDNADAVRGTSLLLDGLLDNIILDDSVSELTDKSKFTIVIVFKPNFSYDVGGTQPLFSYGSGPDDKITVAYGAYVYYLINDINNEGDITGSSQGEYTSDPPLQQWSCMVVSVDLGNDIIKISLNGNIIINESISDNFSSTPDYFVVCQESDVSSTQGSYYIDNVRLYDGYFPDQLRYICHTEHDITTDANEPLIGATWEDYWWEYRMTLGQQYKDLVMDAPTTGDEVIDLVIPMDLSSDGFASDGGRHFEMDAGVLEYTNDIERIGHVDVIKDPPIITGVDTDHLIAHLKCEQYYNTDYLRCEVEDGFTRFRVVGTPANCGFPEAIRGNGLQISDGDGSGISFTTATVGLDKYAGTLMFTYIPDADSVDNNKYFFIFDGSPVFYSYRGASNDIVFGYGGGTVTFSAYPFKAGSPVDLMYSWYDDGTNAYRFLIINGKMERMSVDTNRQTIIDVTCIIGNYLGGTGQWEAEGILENCKIYNGCLLPYGAYFTGNGEVNVDHANKDILAFIEGSSLSIGTGVVTLDGATTATGVWGDADEALEADSDTDLFSIPFVHGVNANKDQGSVSFWYKYTSGTNQNNARFFDYSAEVFALLRNASDTSIIFSGNSLTVHSVWDGAWHYMSFRYDGVAEECWIFIDGIRYDWSSPSFGPYTFDSGNLCFFNRAAKGRYLYGIIDEVIITNNPYTPQIPVILGSGPIHAPIQGIE